MMANNIDINAEIEYFKSHADEMGMSDSERASHIKYLENLGETKKYLVCGEAVSLGATQKFQLITINNNLIFLGYADGIRCRAGKEFVFGTLYTENLERFQKETKTFSFMSYGHPRGIMNFYDSETHLNILGYILLDKLEFASSSGFGIGHWK